ncbi:MAG TPA: hypothetical protein VGX96_02700, partial [Candidatus Elarobacter sp.]|nr:hypothetical protein [Candidatus Elarobacter sp.]
RPASELEALQLALHHFKVAALDDVTASGLQGLTPADLVTMVDHGMTSEFVRGFRGVALVPKTMASLATLRDHGITADYVQAFGSTGYPPVSVDELSSLRDHGVKASLVRAIAHSSYRGVRPAEIAAFADHGVSGEYITDLDRIGYHPVAADVVRLRDRGVPVSFIQRLREHGYGSMSVSDIIKLFEHGI